MPSRYRVPALIACRPEMLAKGDAPLPPEHCYRVEEEIRRSRFVTSMGRAEDKESARCFIDAIRREFPDATHNCWAYAAGSPSDTANVGQSDDGEPHGTAGRPMLNQILHGGVGEVVAVATRYFGGIKLGTGGLVRAYQGGVAQALALLPTEEKVVLARMELVLDYSSLNILYRLLPGFQARIASEHFAADAEFSIELPDDQITALRAALTDATDGHVLFEEQEQE